MSVQLGTREGFVRGNAKILKEFVRYFEGEYDEKELRGLIRNGVFDEHKFLDENCYYFKQWEDNTYIDCGKLSKSFPTLKFEYVDDLMDCLASSGYQIYLNGNVVDRERGNYFVFGNSGGYGDKCEMCNGELDFPSEICDECEEFNKAIEK